MRWWLGFSLNLIAAAACGADVLHRGNGPEPDSLDLHLAQGLSAHNILRDLYDGLVRTTADGELAAAAAESWQVGDDGLTLTFTLRADARWSDGTPVTAADFVAGWRRAVNPETGSPYAAIFEVVESGAAAARGDAPPSSLGVEAADDRTFVVRLVRQAEEFLHQLALPVTFPLHSAQPRVSNGRYRLERWVPQSHVDLVRNEHHPLAENTAIPRVRFHAIEDADAELKRFRAGELHITETVPPGRVPWIKKNLPQALRIAPYYGSYFLGFNLTRPPFEDAAELRRALNLVIDREVLTARLLAAGQRPATRIVPVDETFAIEAAAGRLAQARKLYEAAGYSRQNPLRVEIRVNSGVQHRRLAVAISAMWKQALGVQTEIVREEWKVFVQNRRSRKNTQVFRWGWIGDYGDPLTFLALFESDSPLNASGYASEAYDRLLAKARGERGESRLATLREAEAQLLADDVVIPLYFYVSQHLVSPDVVGWQNNLLDRHPSAGLRLRSS